VVRDFPADRDRPREQGLIRPEQRGDEIRQPLAELERLGLLVPLALVEEGLSKWRAGLAALSEEDFDQPLGPEESYSVGQPFAVLAQWINCELIHHGAEVCLLRDLYRASR
jgi:hypothetical protein